MKAYVLLVAGVILIYAVVTLRSGALVKALAGKGVDNAGSSKQ